MILCSCQGFGAPECSALVELVGGSDCVAEVDRRLISYLCVTLNSSMLYCVCKTLNEW
jgi:hypothetical protein